LADEGTVENLQASVRYWLLGLVIALALITLPGHTQSAGGTSAPHIDAGISRR
jgi:hypothetical protein